MKIKIKLSWVFSLLLAGIFFLLLGLELLYRILGWGVSVSDSLYWMLTFCLVWLVWKIKLPETFALAWGMIFFLIAAGWAIIGFPNTAETLFRIGFIGWVIGLYQSLRKVKG